MSMFPYEVISDVNVLCSGMIDRITNYRDSTCVITKNGNPFQHKSIISKLVSNPKYLSTATPSSYYSASAVEVDTY